MNLKVLFVTALFAVGLMSCGKDDKCTQEDWVGTYELTSGNAGYCKVSEDLDVEFLETLEVTKGSNATSIIISGLETTFNECYATAIFGVTFEKSGDELTMSAGPCKGEYKKK